MEQPAIKLRLARQPIFDRRRRVVGYELLYREHGAIDASDSDALTRSIRSLEALVELGLHHLVGTSTAFLNIDFDHVDCPIFDALPSEQIVFEILEHTQPTQDNIDRIRAMKSRGFELAIDDFAFQPHLEPFLPFVNIIKLETSQLDPARDCHRLGRLIQRGHRLLAEKIETAKDFKAYCDVGCEYFQGFFFARPSLIEGSTVASNKAALISLLAKIHEDQVSIREIEMIVATDVTFAHKLLKLVKSALVAAPPAVQTVGQAVLFLGLRATASIASLLALSAVDDKPSELLVLALSRGKMCEELALRAGFDEPPAYFTVGLLSVLDAFLNRPMEEITENLPLSQGIKEALLGQNETNPMTRALESVKAYEQGNFDEATAHGFDAHQVDVAYRSAIQWADATQQTLRIAEAPATPKTKAA